MKRNIQPYYVAIWEVNKDDIEKYDIIPYLVGCYKRTKKSKRTPTPTTFEEFKKFILDESMYQFWSRCEYEMIITGWPNKKRERKFDVYQQIKMNIDIITKHFMEQVC